MLSSIDGIKWTQHTLPSQSVSDIVWNGTQYLLFATSFVGANDDMKTVTYTSQDGINWIIAGEQEGVSACRVVWNGSQYVAYDSWKNEIITSENGINWQSAIYGQFFSAVWGIPSTID
jgi:hypothetical protein